MSLKNNTTLLNNILDFIENSPSIDEATIEPGDILKDKIAFNSSGKITGTIPSQAAKTITPSTSAQTAIAAGTYASGKVTVAAIPSTYKKVSSKSGTFTSTSTAGGTTVNCGFKPDVVTITLNQTYYDSDIGLTFKMDQSCNFINGTDYVNNTSFDTSTDRAYELFVRRTSSGFTVSVWRYNSSLSSGSWWGNVNFTYYAYKFT